MGCDTRFCGWMLRAVESVAGNPTSYSSPGNDEVTKFMTFSTNIDESKPIRGIAEDRKKTRPNPMDTSFLLLLFLITASDGGSQLAALAFSFLFLFFLFFYFQLTIT